MSELSYTHQEVLVLAATGAALVLAVALQSRRKRRLEQEQEKWPPMAPVGILETIRAFTDGSLPWFHLRVWNTMQRTQGSKLFRLPLPMLPGTCWIVVGNVQLALQVLKDPGTTRPRVGSQEIEQFVASGPSIVTLEGVAWKHRRAATALAFSSHNVSQLQIPMVRVTEKWKTHRLDKFLVGDDNPFDVGPEMVRLTIAIILEAAMDYTVSQEEADFLAQEFYRCTQEFVSSSSSKLNPVRHSPIGKYIYPDVQRSKEARQNVLDFAHRLLRLHREKKKQVEPAGNTSSDKNMEKQNQHSKTTTATLIDCIANNPNYENDDERAYDIVMWMYAGFDNTGYALAWVLVDLANHPKIQQQLRQELANNQTAKKGGNNKNSSKSVLRNIIQESMRLHPTTPAGSIRQVGKEFRFTVEDNNNGSPTEVVIPKGAICQFPSMVYSRDPNVFAEPKEFRPQRWDTTTSTNSGQSHSKNMNMTETFVPFLAGRHNCAGQALTQLEMETVLASLLPYYNFTMVEKGTEKCTITLKPEGYKLAVEKLGV